MSLLSKYYLKIVLVGRCFGSKMQEMVKIRVDILKLRQILADKSIPELVKRRMTALFLEQSIENEENAIWLLHEHEVLEYTLILISQPVLEEISGGRLCG